MDERSRVITGKTVPAVDVRKRAFGLGAVTALASALVPMSYDEAYWLGVARLVGSGRALYDGALDNKTPPVYALVWLLDRLPGPYELWRGLVVGLAGFLLVTGFTAVLRRGENRQAWLGFFLAAVVVLLAELQLAVELLAATFLTFGLRRGRVGAPGRAALVLLGPAFDPRTVLLLPGLLLAAGSDLPPGKARTFRALVIGGATAGVAVVLLVPDLRYGLVELNLSSRITDFTPGPAGILLAWTVPLAALLPVLGSVRPRGADRGRLLLLLGAIAIPVASILPIPHYFIYLPLALLPFFSPDATPFPSRIAWAVAALALTPLLLNLGTAVLAHRRMATAAENAATVLEASLSPMEQFVVFGSLPHLVVALPDSYALRAPTSLYLSFSTSKSDEHRRELAALLGGVGAIVDDGALDVSRESIYPRQRVVYDLFRAALPAFPCTRAGQGFTVRLRPQACGAP